jgi:probable blue pigment (indigoidine) exporter
MLLAGVDGVSWRGVLASASAMLVSAFGHVLGKRWNAGAGSGAGSGAGVDVLASTAWQLTAGGLLLLPVAGMAEGPPPALSVSALLAFGYVTLVATAVAFVAWFSGLRHLPAGTVGLIGLLNPVTGVLLGTMVAGESLTGRQVGGLLLVLAGVVLGRPARGTRRGAVWTFARRVGRFRQGPGRLPSAGPQSRGCPAEGNSEPRGRTPAA